jgi:hypothetical protein
VIFLLACQLARFLLDCLLLLTRRDAASARSDR